MVALSLGAFVLVASEFMPVSLLTPLASDLQITEGHAGQAISISGAFALLTSLFLSPFLGQRDRKPMLLAFMVLTLISGTLVALAPDYLSLMFGRALIGVAIGGFWSMSAATAMRLVPTEQVPRALAILNGGNALAIVIAAPLGSWLGTLIGWRGAFFCVVPIAAIALVWMLSSLPKLQSEHKSIPNTPWKLLTQPVVSLGMLAVSLFFMGQFALFTYLRPFLETVTQVNGAGLSLLLFIMGITGFIGTALIGRFLSSGLYPTLMLTPLFMSAVAGLLTLQGASLSLTTLGLALWGFLGTAAPVGWWTWLARTLPKDAEAGGGLMVALVQLAITLGATLGGTLFDACGYQATFAASATLLILSALTTFLSTRQAQEKRLSKLESVNT